MKIIVTIIAVILFIIVGFFIGKQYLPFLTSDDGKITISTNQKTSVFINSDNKGETPFTQQLKPGTYDVRLVPADETTSASFQKQITVNSGVETYVNVNLAQTESASSWQIITMQKSNSGPSEVSFFSNADASEIFMNNERKGTTPLTLRDVPAGIHDIRFIAQNYQENNVKIQITDNFKFEIVTQLSQISPVSSESASISNESDAQKKISVQILTTPTGWLRVRSEPNKESDELTKVKPEEEYPYLEEQEGWYKIEYEEGKSGWVSSDYAKKIE